MKYFEDKEVIDLQKAEVNMSPLIDMTFLLLIFFMVTAVFVQESGVKVNKPRAETAEIAATENLLIALTKEGRIHYGGQVISSAQLPAIVKKAMQGKTQPVLIMADDGAPTGSLVRVIDLCRLGGAVDVNVAATRDQP